MLALRIIGIEYLQNLPILLGLMLALADPDWAVRLLWVVLGSAASAGTIMLTEQIKLRGLTNRSDSGQSLDVLANTGAFLVGQLLYVAYYVLMRPGFEQPFIGDFGVGLILGGLVGLAQAVLVDTRRIDGQALLHATALALAAGCVLLLVGAAAGNLPPFIAALAICVPMTLIIVRIDYWDVLIHETTRTGA